MSRLACVLAAFALLVSAPPAGAAPPWRVVARASASSPGYSWVDLAVNVHRATAVRLRVSARVPARIDGSVYCARAHEGTARLFSFRLRGTRTLPLPLTQATCDYFVAATLAGGGRITLVLEARH